MLRNWAAFLLQLSIVVNLAGNSACQWWFANVQLNILTGQFFVCCIVIIWVMTIILSISLRLLFLEFHFYFIYFILIYFIFEEHFAARFDQLIFVERIYLICIVYCILLVSLYDAIYLRFTLFLFFIWYERLNAWKNMTILCYFCLFLFAFMFCSFLCMQVRKQYEKACRESEKAQEAYRKSEADIHLSRADVEKAKSLMHTRIDQCNQCKIDYAAVLVKTNNVQKEHFEMLMPQIFLVRFYICSGIRYLLRNVCIIRTCNVCEANN